MHRRIEIDWALSSMTPKAVPACSLGVEIAAARLARLARPERSCQPRCASFARALYEQLDAALTGT
jgi:hypothetical protein